MTPAQARNMYRRQIAAHGETITLRRGATTAIALGRIVQPKPDELIDTLDQTQKVAIVLAEDLEAAGFPLPPQKGDVLTASDSDWFVEFVNNVTRKVGSTVIAYDLTVVG
jgi:hypothetical protein